MEDHKVLSTEEAIKLVLILQEKLFVLDPKHRLVSYKEFSDENTRELCRINLISSFCSNKARPLINLEDLQEAANGYLQALKKRLQELELTKPSERESS